MPLTYDVDNRLQSLTPVLDEHAAWFEVIVQRLFYPENFDPENIPYVPQTFVEWAREMEGMDYPGRMALDDLRKIHNDLHTVTTGLVMSCLKAGRKPDIKEYTALVNLHDEFLVKLHRMEKDFLLEDRGIDAVTGLRTRKAMDIDMERELERRARQGRPFCIVLASLNDLDHYGIVADSDEGHGISRSIADTIRQAMRSFDDAYRCTDSEFVMMLKHTDATGGLAAINRVRELLEEKPALIERDGKSFAVSLSFCTAEPVPGDNIEEMLNNMRKDMSRYDLRGQGTLEYADLSPLQRFVQTMDDDNKPARG